MKLQIKDKIFLSGVLLITVIVYYLFSIQCPIYRITGIPCLGCGMTRAWLSVLELNFVDAFDYHWMFWSVPIVYILFIFESPKARTKKLVKYFYILVLIGFFINWFFKIF